jgi:hypothetical protein
MSHRQSERSSRFQAQIETSIRSAAAVFRDNDVEASVSTAIRSWWTSRMRGRRSGGARLTLELLNPRLFSVGQLHQPRVNDIIDLVQVLSFEPRPLRKRENRRSRLAALFEHLVARLRRRCRPGHWFQAGFGLC